MATPTSTRTQTCEPCYSLLATRDLLKQAMSEEGLNHEVSRDSFRESIQRGCSLCSTFHEMTSQGNLAEMKAQGLFDPEDIEGMDEKDFDSLELFRVLDSQVRPLSAQASPPDRLVRNFHAEVMLGRSRFDITSLRVAAWSADNRYHLDVEFDVSAAEGDPAARYIKTRPLNPLVSSASSFNLAKKWISDCVEKHPLCPKPERNLPSRVINIGSEDGKVPCHIRNTQNLDEAHYAALSYVWGGPQPITLTQASLSSMSKAFNAASLPKTIRDAIHTTRKLGLRYLWIDALCIVQDSEADKDHEISRMDEIYFNAYVTICAASATGCQVGFLEDKALEFVGVVPRPRAQIAFPCPDGKTGTVELISTRTYDPIMEPLNSRAWCFQERLLSPRVLTYGSWQMYWQCQTTQACDGGDVSRFEQAGTERLSLFAFDQANTLDDDATGSLRAIYSNWIGLVQEYNLRDITNHLDRLPALAGIAKKYAMVLKDDTYCAGLWLSHLLPTLAWQNGDAKVSRPEQYRAPTWSWASVDGEVHWVDDVQVMESLMADSVEIIECEVLPWSKDAPLGRVRDGFLKIKGYTKTLVWNGQLHDLEGIESCELHTDILPVEWSEEVDDEDDMDRIFEGDRNGVRYLIPEKYTESVDGYRVMDALCLRLTDISALFLEMRDDGTYQRLGLMVFMSPNGVDDADTWFRDGEVRELVIR